MKPPISFRGAGWHRLLHSYLGALVLTLGSGSAAVLAARLPGLNIGIHPASREAKSGGDQGRHSSSSHRRGGPDANPPQLTLSPGGGTFSTSNVNATVTWCDDSSLYAETRQVTLDGVALTTNYTPLSSTIRCPARAQTSLTLNLTPGSHLLHAQIDDNRLNVGSVDGTFTYASYSVTVTADSSAVTRAARADGVQTFRVTETGVTPATYTLTPTCPAPQFANCSAANAVQLTPGAAVTVNVGYTTNASPGTAALTLQATAQPNGSNSQASTQVTVNAPPVIEDATGAAWTGLDRSRCVAFEIVRDVAAQCDAIRIAQRLPSVRTRNKLRTPTLLYYSDHVYGVGVSANVTVPSQITADSVTLNVYTRTWDGTVSPTPTVSRTYAWSPTYGHTTQRLAISNVFGSTGIDRYHLEAKFWSGGVVQSSNFVDGEILQTNRQFSDFGAGWWLAGLEQIVLGQGGSSAKPDSIVAWIGGDGSMQKYVWQQTIGSQDIYVAARVIDRPDTLVKDTSLPSTPWVRREENNLRVFFDAYGRHTLTINRIADTTRFAWKAGGAVRLDTIIVPGGLKYNLSYDTGDRLVSVTAPPDGATARVVQFERGVLNGALTKGIRKISDVTGDSVTFEWTGWATDMFIGARTDRRRTRTTLDWDPWGPGLINGSTPDGQGHTVSYHLQNAANVGMNPSSPPVPLDSVYTRYIGPRADLPDTTKFWLTSLGSPRRIVDPIGRVTLVRYTDPRFPGLATQTVAPTGLVTMAWYNARGLEDSTALLSPYGDGRNATTKYTWHTSWNFATQIVHPEGDLTNATYDATTGNEVSAQDARGSASQVTFGYGDDNAGRSARLLTSATYPARWAGQSTATYAYQYDSLGNLYQTVSPSDIRTRFIDDAVGRLMVTQHQLALFDYTNWQNDSVRYDLAGRVSREVLYAPARNAGTPYATPAQQAITIHQRDAEGNDTTVIQQSVPDTGHVGTIVRRWTYDNLGRARVTTAPDGQAETASFDEAGNVLSLTTRRGDVLTMEYDRMNRLTKRRIPKYNYPIRNAQGKDEFTSINLNVGPKPWPWYPDSSDGSLHIRADSETFAYDVSGGIAHAENTDAYVRRSYYPNGSLKADTLKILTYSTRDSATHVYGILHQYDRNGRQTVLKYPRQLSPTLLSGAKPDSVVYAYDNAGNLSSVKDLLGQQTTFTYTYCDELFKTQYPANIVDSVGYDTDGRRVYDRVMNGAQSTAFHPYTIPVLRAQVLAYDLAGRATFAGDSLGGRDTTHAYYSGLGHLVSRDYALPAVSAMGNPARLFGSEVFWLDALGNRIKDSTSGNAVSSMPLGGSATSHSAARSYYAFDGSTTHSGRLEGSAYEEFSNQDSTVYDAAGQIIYSFPMWTYDRPHTLDGRASYYGSDGRLRVSEHRMVSSDTLITRQNTWPWTHVVEEYRYDPLGRRVLVRTRRNCNVTNNPTDCNRAEIRRIVWDGPQVLAEIQMPGRDGDSLYFENDTALVRYPASSIPLYFDYNPQYGRTAYMHALGLDRPLVVTRMNYVDTLYGQPGYDRYNDFNIYPLWDYRGHADFGTVTDGGDKACWSATRCATLKWRHQTYAFASGVQNDTLAGWFGQLLQDNADATGLMYRRNRYLDASTGRFTQEDPLGLGGGLNAYGFASGDPVNYSDPFGLWALPCCIENERVMSAFYQISTPWYVRLWNTLKDRRTAEMTWEAFKVIGPAAKGAALGGGLSARQGAIEIPGPTNSPYGKVDYLLDNVPGKTGKGGFFRGVMGFDETNLEPALRTHFSEHAASGVINERGFLEVTGSMTGANGRVANVTTVWQRNDRGVWQLITAQPAPR